MLALLCGAPRVDDLPDGLNYTTTSTRSKRRHFSLPQSQGLFRKNSAKVAVSSPSSFRHEFHIGPEVKDRAAQEIWDECRWRQEIQLRIMQHAMPLSPICDPTVTERPSSDPSPTTKRVSLIKRKPVPVFHADEETLVSASPPASPRITEEFSVQEEAIAEHPMEVVTQDLCPASIPLPPSPTLSTFSLPDPSDHGLPDVIELPEEEEDAEPESDPSTHHSGSDSDSFSSCYTPPATPPDAVLLTRAPTVAQVTDHMKGIQLIHAEKEDTVSEMQKV